jgi:hypothetical protein
MDLKVENFLIDNNVFNILSNPKETMWYEWQRIDYRQAMY